MANSEQHAADWLNFLLAQDLPFAEALSTQVGVGKVGQLCACGCDGFLYIRLRSSRNQRSQFSQGEVRILLDELVEAARNFIHNLKEELSKQIDMTGLL